MDRILQLLTILLVLIAPILGCASYQPIVPNAVQPGDRVRVTTAEGERFTAELIAVSELELVAEDRTILREDIREIARQDADKTEDRLMWLAVIGGLVLLIAGGGGGGFVF